MLNQEKLSKIKGIAREFLDKMTVQSSSIEASLSVEENAINLKINTEEPQILIGQQGQTLFEIQRLLRMILNKKLQEVFYLNLDINDYKEKKVEYLKTLARESADQVALLKQEKVLAPMPAYERRVIHTELSQRTDVIAESQGEGPDRHIVIKLK